MARKNGWIKYAAVIITIVILFASIVAGWTQLKTKQAEFENIGTPLARQNREDIVIMQTNQNAIKDQIEQLRVEQKEGFKEVKALLKE